MALTRYWAEHAWLGGHPGGLVERVLIEVDQERIRNVLTGVATPPPSAIRLPGLTLPGLANAHSHAFHRALRGRAQAGNGTFWSWRERMYSLADRLDPDRYYALARATYAEMALAGVTCVGEFHYLHHGPEGAHYADPNTMGQSLIAAAEAAGIRITLLDTLYLSSTVDGAPLAGTQLRFGDADLDAWSDRTRALAPSPHARIGAAAHSLRAVPAHLLGEFAARTESIPTHVHLSEQRAENAACQAAHGCSPTELLAAHGLLGPSVTAVHATHLSDVDIMLLGDSGTRVCLCPTTERDLADGIGPARALATAGSPLCLGSDSHAMIDLFEEARAVELDERLRSQRRGLFTSDELLHAATSAGHAALGWADAGEIRAGGLADLVIVRLDSVRTAGFSPTGLGATAVFAAAAADVSHVVVGGRLVVRDGVHQLIEDVPGALSTAIARAWA